MASSPLILLTLFLLSLLSLHNSVLSAEIPTVAAAYHCPTMATYASYSPFATNLKTALAALAIQSQTAIFSKVSAGNSADEVFALFFCPLGFSDSCANCVQAAAGNLTSQCPDQREGIAFMAGCTLRYANRPIFSKLELSPNSSSCLMDTVSSETRFDEVFPKTLDLLISIATNNSLKFGETGVEISPTELLVSLAQCSLDITSVECGECLKAIVGLVQTKCPNKKVGLVSMPSCWFAYAVVNPHVASASSSPGRLGLDSVHV